MKLESQYFDFVRCKPEKDRRKQDTMPRCQWPGCTGAAEHKAPQGRGREGSYFDFCTSHAREYNRSYNYFDGMTDEEFVRFQKSAATGHRPTWTIGENSWAHGKVDGTRGKGGEAAGRASGAARGRNQRARPGMRFTGGPASGEDVFGVFSEQTSEKRERKRPIVGNMARKSLKQLSLDESATRVEIKSRFKELVKRHHPDANGGDKASEDKLREVIQAYNYLKQAGHC